MNKFMETYEGFLREDMAARPNICTWPKDLTVEAYLERFRDILEKMVRTGLTGFAKDTPAVKATCKALKIKNTYKDITRFLVNHQ